MTEEETFRNKREYSRVSVFIPIEIRLLPLEEHHRVKSRLSGDALLAGFKKLPSIEDQCTAEWLSLLSNKLDTIIRMMTFDHEGFFSLPYMSVNISGGGMSFDSPTAYNPGDILEIKTLLNTPRPIALYLYGEVVNVERHEDIHAICTQFVMIDDMLRDEIIRFVFEKEREILREKRRVLF